MDELQKYISSIGGIQSFALMNNVKYQSVQAWIKRGFVPPARVMSLSKKTGIEPNKLNPVHFPN